ncbi:MAG TPA: EAL domain-containing protein [Vicinamibacterales bacterium]|nr:EAL domain-containing protein [Vicinamibacterales bacterium]
MEQTIDGAAPPPARELAPSATSQNQEALDLQRLRQAVDASGEIIFTTDRDGVITFVNHQFERLYGYRAADVVGQTTPRILKASGLTPEYYQNFWERLRSGESVRADFHNRAKDGTVIAVEVAVSPIWNETQTSIAGFLAIQRDVTARRRAEAELRRKNLVLATEHNATIDGILVVDEQGRILSFNERFVAMWGLTTDATAAGEDAPLLQRVVEKTAHPDAFFERVRFLYDHRDLTARDEIELADGRTFDRYTAPVRDEDGRYYGRVWFFRDITVTKQSEETLLRAQEQLRHEALHDRLTGLPNRTLLIERLDQALARERREPERHFGVMFVDVDNFKLINDSLGHDVGDQLLVAFARRLQGCLREEDTLARIGGDEFVILTGELNHTQGVRRLSDRIQQQLQQPFYVGTSEIVTTASIGIAESFAFGARTAQDLLRNADTAMYRAKRAGKARTEVFTRSMREEAVDRFQLESDLRNAVTRNEFAIFYQPIVSARTGQITGFEALMRWEHPTRGLLAPGEFLAVADDLGLMMPIGEWMLRSACTDARKWRAAGLKPGRMAVNVSPGQFREPGLADSIDRVLRETGVDPASIELELSENIVLSSAATTMGQLDRLARTGVRLSVDDFGVVHTSVRYLAKFPITTLKIDQSFVRDISSDRAGPVVMKALIGLGHGLHLNVVIEGVETAEQEAFVRACECDEIQGFHVGRVLRPDQAKALLR